MANYSFHKFHHHPQGNPTEGYCAAIGFFDGVHRGHLYLIEQVKTEAEKRGLTPIVISFEEHPRLTLARTADHQPRKTATARSYGIGRLRDVALQPANVDAFVARIYGTRVAR